MKHTKEILLRLLRPGAILSVLITVVAILGLSITFRTGREETPFGYVSYVVAVYALVVLAAYIPKAAKKTKALVYGNSYSRRYLSDVSYRTVVSLYATLLLNLIYAIFKLITGIVYVSFWFGAIAVYYIILCVVRFILLRHMNSGNRTMERGLREYRFCGCLLFVLNIALTGMVYQLIHHGAGYYYPGYLIYVMAAYAFFCLTMSIYNIVKYRKLQNPILSASKAINLATALVAMLSLQTAMFTAFGSDVNNQDLMNGITGGGICAAIFGMALFMVINANRKLKRLKSEEIQKNG